MLPKWNRWIMVGLNSGQSGIEYMDVCPFKAETVRFVNLFILHPRIYYFFVRWKEQYTNSRNYRTIFAKTFDKGTIIGCKNAKKRRCDLNDSYAKATVIVRVKTCFRFVGDERRTKLELKQSKRTQNDTRYRCRSWVDEEVCWNYYLIWLTTLESGRQEAAHCENELRRKWFHQS